MGDFLPTTYEEMIDRGWQQPDFIYVCGDAYVDHPSFGAAIITRTLESRGFKVCFLAQPNWKTIDDFKRFGKPRLGFLVSSGNIDSMVNHYTVAKRKRREDSYSNNGEAGHRPDRAVIVYCQKIREAYRDATILIGGIEASLRRLAHYDYWDDKVRHSILVDSSADLLMYGMGENSIIEIAEALDSGLDVKYLTYLDGTVYKTKDLSVVGDHIMLPSFHEVSTNKETYARSFGVQYLNTDHYNAKVLVEPYDGYYIVQNRPNRPLTQMEFDDTYALHYQRTFHPMYQDIPAIKEVKFSLISNRGCFGACNFCALNFHQGRIIQTRSHESLIDEAKLMIEDKEFKGYIHDVGGPTANFYHPACKKQLKNGVCKHKQCLWPKPCKNLDTDHSEYLKLLRKLRELPKVKKVFVRSGIRFDYIMEDRNDTFFKELVEHHISGQLKVAPEHISDKVLSYMGKPQNCVYEKFIDKYYKFNDRAGKKQFVVPYLMSSHPGSDMKEAVKLAEYLRDIGYNPQQVQDFYPTPSTMSTVMYYTGVDPRTMEPVYTPKNPHEKAMQRALMQYRNPANYELVKEALHIAGREDLIGFGRECLIKPRQFKKEKDRYQRVRSKASKSQGKTNKNKKSGRKGNRHTL